VAGRARKSAANKDKAPNKPAADTTKKSMGGKKSEAAGKKSMGGKKSEGPAKRQS